jgi:hypothetical protein
VGTDLSAATRFLAGLLLTLFLFQLLLTLRFLFLTTGEQVLYLPIDLLILCCSQKEALTPAKKSIRRFHLTWHWSPRRKKFSASCGTLRPFQRLPLSIILCPFDFRSGSKSRWVHSAVLPPLTMTPNLKTCPFE